jgi:hypothetical protein
MHGVHKPPDDDHHRLLRPANVVKWYREIAGLDPGAPLPSNVSYSEMLAIVLEHDYVARGK